MRRIQQLDLPAPAIDNGLDDRQPQPRARRLSACHTVKRIQHPGALARRNAGAVVFYLQNDAALRLTRRQVHPPAIGRVANGVVHQVFDHGGDLYRMRAQLQAVAFFPVCAFGHAHVDVPLLGQRHQVFKHLPKHIVQRHGLGLLSRWLLRARHGQQLIEQAAVALNALLQGLQPLVRGV